MTKKMPKSFWDDRDWAFDHYGELVRKYGNMWVAIANHKVVSASKNLSQVEKTARTKTGLEHIPVIYVEKGVHVY